MILERYIYKQLMKHKEKFEQEVGFQGKTEGSLEAGNDGGDVVVFGILLVLLVVTTYFWVKALFLAAQRKDYVALLLVFFIGFPAAVIYLMIGKPLNGKRRRKRSRRRLKK